MSCFLTPRGPSQNNKHLAAPKVPEDLARRVVPRSSGDASARMRAGTAEIEPAHGRTVIGIAEHRSCRKQLVERERTVEDVSADQTEVAFEIERGEDFPGDDALLEIRRVAVHRFDD